MNGARISFPPTRNSGSSEPSLPEPNGLTVQWLWRKVPPNCVILDGAIIPLEAEVGTREAARLLGISQRYMQAKCDEGQLLEGRDWRKLPGRSPNTKYLIRLSAILRMRQAESGNM